MSRPALAPNLVLFDEAAVRGAGRRAIRLDAEEIRFLTESVLGRLGLDDGPRGHPVVRFMNLRGEQSGLKDLPRLAGGSGLAPLEAATWPEPDYDAPGIDLNCEEAAYWHVEGSTPSLRSQVYNYTGGYDYAIWDVLAAGLATGTLEDVKEHLARIAAVPNVFDHMVTPLDQPETFAPVVDVAAWRKLWTEQELAPFLTSERREVREATIRSLGQGGRSR